MLIFLQGIDYPKIEKGKKNQQVKKIFFGRVWVVGFIHLTFLQIKVQIFKIDWIYDPLIEFCVWYCIMLFIHYIQN